MTEIGSNRQARFDVVVVGAGPAGVAAAVHRSGRGADRGGGGGHRRLGGQIWRLEQAASMPRQGRRWLARFQASGAQLLPGSTAVAAPAARRAADRVSPRALGDPVEEAHPRDGRPRTTAALPRLDAGERGGRGWPASRWSRQAGLWPASGSWWQAAAPCSSQSPPASARHGAKVVVLAEQTPWLHLFGFGTFLPVLAPSKLIQAAEYQTRLLGVRYRPGCWPVSAQGKDQVESVTLSTGARTWTIPCDVLACGFNLVANLELPRLLGCRIVDGKVHVDPWQETSVPNVYCAGEPTGLGGVDRALIEGQIAGFAVTGQQDRAKRLFASRGRAWMFSRTLDRGFALRHEVLNLARPDTIVCRCEDVTLGQLQRYDHWRDARLHTRCGMGTCQGRICGGAVQALFGWETASVRPPVFPTSIASLASVDGTANEDIQETVDRREETGGRTRNVPVPHSY